MFNKYALAAALIASADASEPSRAPSMGNGDSYRTMFWRRLDYSLYSADSTFDTWAEWASEEDDDYKWYADNYSGYVMQYKLYNYDAITVSGFPTLWDSSRTKNGYCVQDKREATDLGG